MPDKRDECGCHRDCGYEPHQCQRPCQWPACLTDAEHEALCAELALDETLRSGHGP
jgi:hypothetical protein